MKFRKQLKGFIAGFIAATLFFTTVFTVFAEPIQKTVSVVYNNIKIYVDGRLIHPTDGTGNPVEPMIYNGTTYLPVRAVAQALGKPVRWDGATNSVYLGEGTSAYQGGDSDGSKPYEIKWYIVGNGQPKDMELVEQEANKYIKDKINATIRLTCYDWTTYNDRLAIMMAAGEPFDICFTATWMNNYRRNASIGLFLPLNDLMDQYAPKTKELLGKDFLSGTAIGGVNYAIPANKDKAHSWGFIFRQDLVNKYGFNINSVKKLEDLEPMLKIIKEKEKGIYPLGLKNGESPYSQLDWDKVSDDDVPGAVYSGNKIVNEFEMPQTMAMFKTLHKFYSAGYIRKDAATAGESYAPDQKSGKMFCYSSNLRPDKDREMSYSSYDWVQQYITPPVMSNREVEGSMMAISRTSGNPAKAMQFLELFNTDKYLNNLINFGIEGRHYTKKSDNVVEPIWDSGYDEMLGMGWALGNQFLNYLTPNQSPDMWEKYLEFNNNAIPLRSLGFRFNPNPVQTEISACKAVYREYMTQLETGTADPEVTLPKFIDALKKAGSDKVIAEMQDQYDLWLVTDGAR